MEGGAHRRVDARRRDARRAAASGGQGQPQRYHQGAAHGRLLPHGLQRPGDRRAERRSRARPLPPRRERLLGSVDADAHFADQCLLRGAPLCAVDAQGVGGADAVRGPERQAHDAALGHCADPGQEVAQVRGDVRQGREALQGGLLRRRRKALRARHQEPQGCRHLKNQMSTPLDGDGTVCFADAFHERGRCMQCIAAPSTREFHRGRPSCKLALSGGIRVHHETKGAGACSAPWPPRRVASCLNQSTEACLLLAACTETEDLYLLSRSPEATRTHVSEVRRAAAGCAFRDAAGYNSRRTKCNLRRNRPEKPRLHSPSIVATMA
mmetsp:Transcript_28385/g.66450  ORF Transcript_28385/g.66450 Transcript_28385/m.66450 type:complete len:324 (-) Transcript_28385:127-1098(-)